MTSKKLKIVHIIAEVSPYSKSGGLGDVGSALPKAISRLGHEVIVVTPYYGSVRNQNLKKEVLDFGQKIKIAGAEYPLSYRKFISPEGVTIYFVVNEELFGSHLGIYHVMEDEALRWIFYARASIELLKVINFQPAIIHTHDWMAGLVPNYLKSDYKNDAFFAETSIIFTVHNLEYQGAGKNRDTIDSKHKDKGTGSPPEQKNFRNYINFVKRGILFADVITTVSERYAQEILTPKFGAGLDPYLRRRKNRVFGIINGIDYEVINPAFDKHVIYQYDFKSLDKKNQNKLALQKKAGLAVSADIPLLGVVNRLTEQKGFDLIIKAMPCLIKMNLQIAIIGSGRRPDYKEFFRGLTKKFPQKIAFYCPFTQEVASQIYAASDIYLMPSRYEPCGLSQLISLRYGSIPVVHAVGGLHDTITDYNPANDSGNGFVFENYEKDELLVAIARACESFKYKEQWKKLVYRAMKQSFSWELPARKYLELYSITLKLNNKPPA